MFFGINLAPILIHMMVAGTASAAAAEAEPFPTAAVVDLSKELEVDESAVSSSPGSMAINDYASSNPLIRTMMVLQDGKVVAKYVREDVDENVPNDTNSVTKSWTSLIMGMLIDEGKIALNSTLGSIFTDEQTWEDVPDSEIRKEVTVSQYMFMYTNTNFGNDRSSLLPTDMFAAFSSDNQRLKISSHKKADSIKVMMKVWNTILHIHIVILC